MYSAIWAYPWDFLDEGVDTALGRIADAGLQAVSIAAAYHTVRALCPHNPNRAVYHGEGGVLYFQPDPRHFAECGIRPVISEIAADVDPLAEICLAARQRGIRVHAWTVLHHNTRLGTAYPDCTIENAFGDRYPFGLCPANPRVRAYSVGIAAALAERDDLDVIELESLGYMGMDHSGHHAKAGIALDALHRFLLSICFCQFCSARIAELGADVKAARETVVREVRAFFYGSSTVGSGDPAVEFATVLGTANANAILDARDGVVLGLLGDIRDVVAGRKNISLMISGDRLTTGAPVAIQLEEAGRVSDTLLHQAFARETAAIRDAVASIVARRGDKPVYAGLQAVAPYVQTQADLAERMAAVRDVGAAGVEFYHYGLMPLRNLDWIARSIRQ